MLKQLQDLFKKKEIAIIFHPPTSQWLAISSTRKDNAYLMSDWCEYLGEAIAKAKKTTTYSDLEITKRAKANGWRLDGGVMCKEVVDFLQTDIKCLASDIVKLSNLL